MNFKCEKCDYTTNNKASFTKHMNRKTPCKKKEVSENTDEPRSERYVEPRSEQSTAENKQSVSKERQPVVDNNNGTNDESENNPTTILRISEDMLIDMMVMYYHSYKMMERKYGQEFVEKEKPNLKRLLYELLRIED